MANQIPELSLIRKVNKQGKMYYISLPQAVGKPLYKKRVIVKIMPLPEEMQ